VSFFTSAPVSAQELPLLVTVVPSAMLIRLWFVTLPLRLPL
jgi:hypothetical protein